MEENILSLRFSTKELNVVYDQHIDHLIEVDEIVLFVVSYGIDELVCELLGRNIKYGLIREAVFHVDTDGVCQVCFS